LIWRGKQTDLFGEGQYFYSFAETTQSESLGQKGSEKASFITATVKIVANSYRHRLVTYSKHITT